jgi:hypothetical protein
MAIQTKRVAEGVLAASLSSTATVQRISNSSDWFESRAGESPEQANYLVVSVLVENAALVLGSEELAIDLFESGDLSDWRHVVELAGSTSIPGLGLYELVYTYPAPPSAPLKYLRLQFSIDDAGAVGFAVPYPPHRRVFSSAGPVGWRSGTSEQSQTE